MGERTSYIIAAIILAVAAAMGNTLRLHEPPADSEINLDAVVLGRTGAPGGDAFDDEPLSGEFLDVLNAESVSFRTYRLQDAPPVWVFLGYFSRQKEGSQVHSPRHCYPGSGWSILEQSGVEVPWSDIELASLVVSDGTERRLVHYWYQTAGLVLNDVFDLKRHLTKNAILGRSQEVVFARVSTLLGGDRVAAADRLERYANDIHSQLSELYARRAVGGDR